MPEADAKCCCILFLQVLRQAPQDFALAMLMGRVLCILWQAVLNTNSRCNHQ